MIRMKPDTTTRTQRFNTTRFGEVEIEEKEILFFPEGLPGFQEFNHYVLLKDPGQDPFLWMQSTQAPDLAFVVVDPFIFFPGYEIQVKPYELSTIELEDVSKATVLVILTIPENPMDLTANLRGPLVVNADRNLAKQLVLIDDRYHTRHFLLKELPPYLASPLNPAEPAIDSQKTSTTTDPVVREKPAKRNQQRPYNPKRRQQ